MQSHYVLESKVSFQSSAWSSILKNITIRETLNEIRYGKYSSQIMELRSYLDAGLKDIYQKNKKKLPAVTFCATFYCSRNKSELIKYNELMIIDIDKLDLQRLEKVKKVLFDDNYVFSFWESPSKKGLKALVKLRFANTEPHLIDSFHKTAFKRIQNYFRQKYSIEIDNSGSDFTRLCFLSADEKIVVKKDLVEFEITQVSKTSLGDEKHGFKNLNDPILNESQQMESIINYLNHNNLSITATYQEWYKVAFAIAKTFCFETGEEYYLSLCRLDKELYDETACIKMLRYCYKNTSRALTFRSIVFFARKKGYKCKLNDGE